MKWKLSRNLPAALLATFPMLFFACADGDLAPTETSQLAASDEVPHEPTETDNAYVAEALERARTADAAGRSDEAELWRAAADDPDVLRAVFGETAPHDPDAPSIVVSHRDDTNNDGVCTVDLMTEEDIRAEGERIQERIAEREPIPVRHVPEPGHRTFRDRLATHDRTVEWHVEMPSPPREFASLMADFIDAGCGNDEAQFDDECRRHPYAVANYQLEWDLDERDSH